MSIEDEFGEELGGDPVGETDSDDSTEDSAGGSGTGAIGGTGGGGALGGFISSWDDLSLPTTLQSFLSNPQGFVIGAVATAILESVFGVVTTAINMIIRVFLGSAPGQFNAPGETLGLADVPVYVIDQILRVGGYGSTAILLAIESLNEPVFALASNAGPATPLIITGVVVAEVIALLWLFERAVYVLADLLQLGGLTE